MWHIMESEKIIHINYWYAVYRKTSTILLGKKMNNYKRNIRSSRSGCDVIIWAGLFAVQPAGQLLFLFGAP
jgi:hypothetical protein